MREVGQGGPADQMLLWWRARARHSPDEIDPDLWRLFRDSRKRLEIDEADLARGRERVLQNIAEMRVSGRWTPSPPTCKGFTRLSALARHRPFFLYIAMLAAVACLLGGTGLVALRATGAIEQLQPTVSTPARGRRGTDGGDLETATPALPVVATPSSAARTQGFIAERDGSRFKLRARIRPGTSRTSVALDTVLGPLTLSYAGAVVHAPRSPVMSPTLAEYVGSSVDVSGHCLDDRIGTRIVNAAEASAQGMASLDARDFTDCVVDSVQILGPPVTVPAHAAATASSTKAPRQMPGAASPTALPGIPQGQSAPASTPQTRGRSSAAGSAKAPTAR